MIAPPSTAEISKTLAKLLQYYNSLNKVTLLCKVSVWCVLFNFLNQKLQISNLCGRQQQQQQHPACAVMTVAVQRMIHWLWRTVCKFDNKVWCEYRPRPFSFNMWSLVTAFRSSAGFKSWDEPGHSLLLKSMPLCRSSSCVARAWNMAPCHAESELLGHLARCPRLGEKWEHYQSGWCCENARLSCNRS